MAKGKHSAQSATRRAEAAHEHIDRLTDQLVEAKTRARRYEADALRVPKMEQELSRLRAQIEEGTSDALERMREMWRADVERLEDRVRRLGALIEDVLSRNDAALTPSNLAERNACLKDIFEVGKDRDLPRRFRRSKIKSGQDLLSHASDADLRQYGVRRAGERFYGAALGDRGGHRSPGAERQVEE